jgi:formate-dependent nitrite reductase membrane component NrfD
MGGRYSSGDAILDFWIVVAGVALIVFSYRRVRSGTKPAPSGNTILACAITLVVLLLLRFAW